MQKQLKVIPIYDPLCDLGLTICGELLRWMGGRLLYIDKELSNGCDERYEIGREGLRHRNALTALCVCLRKNDGIDEALNKLGGEERQRLIEELRHNYDVMAEAGHHHYYQLEIERRLGVASMEGGP